MERKYEEIQQDELRQRLESMAIVHTAEHFGAGVPDSAYETMAAALDDNTGKWEDIEQQDWFKAAQQIAEDRQFFHWKLEFPEVFYQTDGSTKPDPGFDAVIGNPPYVSNWELTAQDDELPGILEEMYPEVTAGHWDLFVVFGYRGMTLTKDAGHHSFITPSTLGTEKYGTKLREYLVTECTLQTLVNFGEHQVFEEVDRQYLIYIASPTAAEDNETEIVSYAGGSFDPVTTTPQEQFLDYSNNSFRVALREEDIAIKTKIEEKGLQLGHLCCVNPGVVAHSGSHSDLDFDKDDVIYEQDEGGFKKYVEGRNIDRYEADWDGLYMDYDSKQEHFHRPKFPELFESPKIMFCGVSGSNNRIVSCYDENGYYTNHNVMHAVLWMPDITDYQSSMDYEIDDCAEKYDLRFTAAVVNSKPLSYYFSKFLATGTLQGSYTGMYPEDIRTLPVPEVDFDAGGDVDIDRWKQAYTAYLSEDCDRTQLIDRIEAELQVDTSCTAVVHDILAYLTDQMVELKDQRGALNLDLLDYLGSYDKGNELGDQYMPAEGVADSIVTETAKTRENLRVGRTTVDEEGENLVLSVIARYKPEDEDQYETDRWGYTETEFIPVMEFTGLSDTERALIREFVPVAIDEAGGFAGFRETATKTNSLLDRLEALTLPAIDDAADGVNRYLTTKGQADELDERIAKTDDLIDQIVYRLYDLTVEEIELIEEAVHG